MARTLSTQPRHTGLIGAAPKLMLERIRALVADFRAFSQEMDEYREEQRVKREQAYKPLVEPFNPEIGVTTSDSRGEW